MHNTSTEYKQIHSQTISWNDNWILIFICLVGWLLEPSASYLLIHLSILDKRFFKIWVLHIPHCLRDLLWIVRAWYSVSPILSSLIMSQYSPCVHSSQILLKVIKFLLAHIPGMNESHDLGRPFKEVITIYYSSSIALS